MQHKISFQLKKKICLVSSAMIIALAFSAVNPAAGKTRVPGMTDESGLRINIDQADQIFGSPFSITIQGLKPGEQATIKARSTDISGTRWESSAFFKANAKGIIDVGKQIPISGDYSEADNLGLLWSMMPQNPKGKRVPSYRHDEVNGLTVDFTVTDSEGQTATARLRRYYQMPGKGLVRVPLEQDGLYGFLYYPASGGPFPGVIILGGSGGGLYEWLAQAFASNGFAALTLAYFNYRDLPPDLMKIPLEFFHKAAAKGGELALLLGATYNDYKVIVAWVPSGYVWQGISQTMQLASSWSLNGQDLPCLTGVLRPEDIAKYEKGELDSVRHFYSLGLEQADSARVEKAMIPVEKIKAPILLVSGTDDQTWPSAEFSDIIMDKLKKHNHPYEYKHVRYEGGGHQVFLPYFITGPNRSMKGGNVKDEVRGSLLSWTETIAFLRRHLDR